MLRGWLLAFVSPISGFSAGMVTMSIVAATVRGNREPSWHDWQAQGYVVPYFFLNKKGRPSPGGLSLYVHNRKSPHDFHRKGLISMEPIVRFELTTY